MGPGLDDSRSSGQRVREGGSRGPSWRAEEAHRELLGLGSISPMAGLPGAGEGPGAGRRAWLAADGASAPCYPGETCSPPPTPVASPGPLGTQLVPECLSNSGTAYVVLGGTLCPSPCPAGVPA